LKINGSLARKALKELEAKNIIKPIEKHSAQQIYSISPEHCFHFSALFFVGKD